jgi:hypothetical protein
VERHADIRRQSSFRGKGYGRAGRFAFPRAEAIEIPQVPEYCGSMRVAPTLRKTNLTLLAFAAAALSILSALPARAFLLQPLSLEEITRYAGRVVDATCVSNEVRPDSTGRIHYRYITFQVHDTLKGEVSDTAVVRVVAIGDTLARAWGMPVFSPGDRAIIFLTPPNRDGYPYLVGVGMGCYHLENGIARQHTAPRPPRAAISGQAVGRYIGVAPVDALKSAIRESVGP